MRAAKLSYESMRLHRVAAFRSADMQDHRYPDTIKSTKDEIRYVCSHKTDRECVCFSCESCQQDWLDRPWKERR